MYGEGGPRPGLLQRWREWAPATLLIIGLLVVWEVGVRVSGTPEWLLPAPSAIAAAFVDSAPLLVGHTERTLVETAVGLAVSIVTGVALAVAVDLLPSLRRAIYPVLVVSQTIPIIALAPLLVVWFGFGLLPRVLVVTLVCFFPIAISTAQGLASADPDMVALLASMGASRFQIFRKVRLPGALPSAFAGLRIAATYAVIGAVISEWVGASRGLGIFMIRSANSYLTARLFSAIALASVLSIALFGLVVLVERLALPWYYAARREERWEDIR
ncbi:MAG: ABC transporter permease [Anaerolineae bacterium]|jgi:ABC-type nitrate/sulfonate/bicarbonate transport system permease component